MVLDVGRSQPADPVLYMVQWLQRQAGMQISPAMADSVNGASNNVGGGANRDNWDERFQPMNEDDALDLDELEDVGIRKETDTRQKYAPEILHSPFSLSR